MLLRFESPREVALAFRADCPSIATCTKHNDWSGGNNAETLAWAANGGDPQYVAAAEALMQEIQILLPATIHSQWENDVFGHFPDVNAFLAGQPNCMRRRAYVERDNHPVHILAGLAGSAGVPHEAMTRRGIAILALTMLLQAVRGCRLYVVEFLAGPAATHPEAITHGEGVLLCHIPSEPLSFAEAGHALCNPHFARGIGFRMISWHATGHSKIPGYGSWPDHCNPRDQTSYFRHLARRGDFPEDTILVPTPITEHSNQILDDPVGWISAQIRPFLPAED